MTERGIALPWRFDAGRTALTPATDSGEHDLLTQAVRRVSLVREGEALMEGERGSKLDLVVNDPNDETLNNIALYYAVVAVLTLETRVDVVDAQAVSDGNTVHGTITLRVRSTGEVRTVVAFERSPEDV